MKSLTEVDFEQFKMSNRSVELIQRQYEFLVHGTSLQKEIKAATLGNGIQKLNPEAETAAIENFHKQKGRISLMKFVPASGAASRMFAPFFTFQRAKETSNFDFQEYFNSEEGSSIKSLFNELKRLPFFSSAYGKIVQDSSISIDTDMDFFTAFVNMVLDENGLAYPNLPKAFLLKIDGI